MLTNLFDNCFFQQFILPMSSIVEGDHWWCHQMPDATWKIEYSPDSNTLMHNNLSDNSFKMHLLLWHGSSRTLALYSMLLSPCFVCFHSLLLPIGSYFSSRLYWSNPAVLLWISIQKSLLMFLNLCPLLPNCTTPHFSYMHYN